MKSHDDLEFWEFAMPALGYDKGLFFLVFLMVEIGFSKG